MTVFAGDTIDSADINTTASVEAKDSAVTNGTTTSTAFTNTLTTTGIRGIAFVAPVSGSVFVYSNLGGYNSTIGQYTLTDIEVRTGSIVGSGTVVRASDENSATQFISTAANASGQHSGITLVTGLTAGTTYNVCIVYRVTANTGTWNRRKISVQPVQ